ncbi:GNAT family N-acetyltransferase [Kribbella pittospori]|uniref:GNAT family N-acetyltransferase n=2 Tax=Kribbella pittospori TaxID=722689 RepID=A0A4R0K7T6_9ACTN|nr:GNAT family N-acetyltransferase [Kribbella pittospori]
MTSRRDFRGADDLRAMQRLVQRLWTVDSNWHIGDLAWQRRTVPGVESTWRTSLWEDNGETVAWGWVELPGHLSLVTDVSRLELAADVIAWFEEVASAPELTCSVLETEVHLTAALESAGYRADVEAPFVTHHHRSLASVAVPSCPDGYLLRHVRPDEAERRSAGHRATWSDFGSTLSADTYQSVMNAWPYRHELDWVVEDHDGNFVSTSLAWLDEANKVGLIEPVGTDPAHRRRGLATAVNLAALTALRDAGATQAIVNPRGDPAYPVAAKLYQSIDFHPCPQTTTYKKNHT